MAQSYIDHPHDSAVRRDNAELILRKTKEKHARIKGQFVTIPEFVPHTEIFIREGRDPAKVISGFLSRYLAVKEVRV